MSLLIHKNTLYYDYRLFKLKVCDIQFEKIVSLSDQDVYPQDTIYYMFSHTYTHPKLLNIVLLMLWTTFITQLIMHYLDMKNIFYFINLLHIAIFHYIDHVYSNKSIHISCYYIERLHFIDPIISYKLIDKKDNNYKLDILYNGLSYKDYYIQSINSLKRELDQYMIPDISKIIIRKMIFKN